MKTEVQCKQQAVSDGGLTVVFPQRFSQTLDNSHGVQTLWEEPESHTQSVQNTGADGLKSA